MVYAYHEKYSHESPQGLRIFGKVHQALTPLLECSDIRDSSEALGMLEGI